jgi:hypothetical protein
MLMLMLNGVRVGETCVIDANAFQMWNCVAEIELTVVTGIALQFWLDCSDG